MRTSDFDYYLPQQLIAQVPAEPRDSSRLMVLDRAGCSTSHYRFSDLPALLNRDDVLVLNDSRVIPARLTASMENGHAVEIFLLRRRDGKVWETLAWPARKLTQGTRLQMYGAEDVMAEVVGISEGGGIRLVRFSSEERLAEMGTIPLPPYIKTSLADKERYQTVYSREEGSVAAPTAGLHFTERLVGELRARGMETVFITLHIGLDTFRPIQVEDPDCHPIHREYGIVDRAASETIGRARREGRRIVAVGTSTVRLLEAAARSGRGSVAPFSDWVDLFIKPGYEFQVVNAMVTNFHMPRTTLILLVSAFAGREATLEAYAEAKRFGYRFCSFGDAMLIL